MVKKTKSKKDKKLEIKFAPSFFDSAERLFSNSLRYLIPRTLSDWKARLKWSWQRVFRGFDDPDVWNFHSEVATKFPKMLRQLKNKHCGCPQDLFDNKKKNKECWKWEEVLEKMACGFEAARKISDREYMKKVNLKKPKKDIFGEDCDYDFKFDKRYYNKLNKEFDDGFKLFKKYFFNLWD